MRIGPQTGARDGGREFKADTKGRGMQTFSNWKGEDQARKKAEKKAAALAKKQAKKAAQ
jgi:hypothetical protein